MKRFIAILLCAVFFASMASAFAESNNKLELLGYELNDTSLDVIAYADSSDAATPEDFMFEINGESYKPEQLVLYEESPYSASWIVIVEPTAYKQASAMVKSIVEELLKAIPNNQYVAICNASTMEISNYSHVDKELESSVGEALSAKGDIRLYDSIGKSLDMLNSESNLSKRKCLLIITENKDLNSEISFSMACEKAKDMPVTIYHVGITRGDMDLSRKNKEMQTLVKSNDSGSSIEITNIGDPGNGSTIIQKFMQNEKRVFVLSLSRDKLPTTKDDKPLELNLVFVKNGVRATESMAIDMAANKNAKDDSSKDSKTKDSGTDDTEHKHVWTDATCTEPKTCHLCGETEGDALGHDFSSTTFFTSGVCSRCGEKNLSTCAKAIAWVETHVVVSCVAAGVIVLMIVLIIRKARRGKEIDDEETRTELSPDVGGQTGGENWKTVRVEDGDSGKTVSVKPKLTVTLTNIANGQVFTGKMYDSMLTAGRSSKFKLTGDGSISGKQMSFIWDSGILYLQDEKSTNGTLVNDKRIDTAVQLAQKDLIHVGQTDFRVTWQTPQ